VLIGGEDSIVSCTLQVDATVVAGFTAFSTFQELAPQSQAKHRAVLEHALHSIGIDVRSSCLCPACAAGHIIRCHQEAGCFHLSHGYVSQLSPRIVFAPQGNILGTSLNTGPFLAHNVPILAARLPFYFYFLDMSSFTVLLAVSVCCLRRHQHAKLSSGRRCLKRRAFTVDGWTASWTAWRADVSHRVCCHPAV
jgi:hypothetical protein